LLARLPWGIRWKFQAEPLDDLILTWREPVYPRKPKHQVGEVDVQVQTIYVTVVSRYIGRYGKLLEAAYVKQGGDSFTSVLSFLKRFVMMEVAPPRAT
jgi:hypothetical protein